MAKKIINWRTKGMNRDLSVSIFNAEFAFENYNLRLSTKESNTTMSWVNERGTKEMILYIDTTPSASEESEERYSNKIEGTSIGTAVINHQLVIFTTGDTDIIYVLKRSTESNIDLEGRVIYKGNLNFDTKHPLETLCSYEASDIQKVYWVDGKNQPRVININTTYYDSKIYNSNPFDFIQELSLQEVVKVTKIFGIGEFPAGVIQYAFAYYTKYGQESNIFYTTPLQYTSYVDRGGSPDSKIANAFKIEIQNLDSHNFDYLRVYSIMRTSLNATPIAKRVQDIKLDSDSITFIDDGLKGDSIDPTELLYIGGEEIVAKTLEQKDNTLFLGNITSQKHIIGTTIQKDITESAKTNLIQSTSAIRPFLVAQKDPFPYVCTLSAPDTEEYQGSAGFKYNEYYRLGIQFQYKTGKWSEPCWVGDAQQTVSPKYNSSESTGNIVVPEFKWLLSNDIIKDLYNAGYKRVRPLFAVPNFSDRTILCQGIACPTMYQKCSRYSNASEGETTREDGKKEWKGSDTNGLLYAQSSWLFRSPVNFKTIENKYSTGNAQNGGGKVSYIGYLKSQFDTPNITDGDITTLDYNKVYSPYLRDTEIMGDFNDGHSFYIDPYFITLHSPEFILDETYNNVDYSGCTVHRVGTIYLDKTYGDIDIQTSTATIGSDAAGVIHHSITTDGTAALISGLFYNDYIVDDIKEGSEYKYEAYKGDSENPPIDFPIYMWHKNGSLNNDVNRSNRSAELLKKRISNYRFSTKTVYSSKESINFESNDIQYFDSDQVSIIKLNGHIYMGNIETMLTVDTPSPHYFVGNPYRTEVDTDFTSYCRYKLALKDPNKTDSKCGIWEWGFVGAWDWFNFGDLDDIGDYVKGLDQWREPISMKYKSTPHAVIELKEGTDPSTGESYPNMYTSLSNNYIPLLEIQKAYNKDLLYGGTSLDALKANTWIPCGPIEPLVENSETKGITIHYKWGDTYFQRYECLKTYPFTNEDKNQVIEIASFVCESRVNMDGRYDRNRSQTSNLNMSPQNFNKINPVYSQMDNFFSYKMLSKDDYERVSYPNNITWSKTKDNGADVDLWTNITMANILEMDGDKGNINKLIRLNDQLISFQDKGIAQILYNENTQISTTEGVPIELANSGKVQGKRYLSNTVGCSNKWSIVQTPSGIYFMDNNEKSIYLFNGQLNNLSTSGGFNTWSKQNIPSVLSEEGIWNPVDFNNFVTYYDNQNQDVLFINKNIALAYSEKFGCFTSFYDYGNAPFLVHFDDSEYWIKDCIIYKHQTGDYCKFFNENKPFSMTLIGNQDPQFDKIFTNIEFRSNVEGEGLYDNDKFTPYLPFDTLEAWNEYQHGIISLSNRDAGYKYNHSHIDGKEFLNRKFRMWRCNIPRDNAPIDTSKEASMGIKRFKVRPLERMRNPWVYLKLTKNASPTLNQCKTEIHDLMVYYFS